MKINTKTELNLNRQRKKGENIQWEQQTFSVISVMWNDEELLGISDDKYFILYNFRKDLSSMSHWIVEELFFSISKEGNKKLKQEYLIKKGLL